MGNKAKKVSEYEYLRQSKYGHKIIIELGHKTHQKRTLESAYKYAFRILNSHEFADLKIREVVVLDGLMQINIHRIKFASL